MFAASRCRHGKMNAGEFALFVSKKAAESAVESISIPVEREAFYLVGVVDRTYEGAFIDSMYRSLARGL